MKRTDGVELRLQVRDEVEHLGLDRRVEPGRRLVEDEERGILRERHRDHDALLHAARELVRVAATSPSRDRRSARVPERSRARVRDASLCDAPSTVNASATCAPDPDRRVQGRAGVLVDHRDRVVRGSSRSLAPLKRENVAPGDRDRPPGHAPVPREVADDRERCRRLPASRLAHEAVRLSAPDLEGDAAQHLSVAPADAVDDVEVAELERGGRLRSSLEHLLDRRPRRG